MYVCMGIVRVKGKSKVNDYRGTSIKETPKEDKSLKGQKVGP